MANVAEIDVLSEVLKLIVSTLKVPADEIDIDANLESFGVNSLIVMELMENIEKAFDITLTPAQFSNIDTIRGLTGLVESLLVKEAPAAAPTAAAAPAAPLPGRAGDAGASDVLDYVSRRFAVDLSYRAFSSVEDIADALVFNHASDLLRHYGLSDAIEQGSRAGAPARAPLIAIVGMSCRLPDAPNPRAYWDNLIAQRNSMREIPASRWNWEDHYSETAAQGKSVTKWGALIDDVDCFDAAFFNIPAAEARTIDPQLRLLLEETYRAVEDAGIDMKKLAGSRTGMFVGYEYAEYEHHLRKLNNKDFTKGPLFSSSSPSYYLSNRISYTFDLCGPSESYNVNCASAAVAVNNAFYSLLNRESDVAIAAAASLNLFADDYIAASQYGILSPNGTSGVFDDDANGFTRGEGVAAVVLKRLDDAERDNDRIYGVIRASHQNYRGAARNISEVKHEAITNVLGECYEKAAVAAEAIDYVEVDGYASKWADSFEYEGIKGAFAKSKERGKHVALGSVKGNIGNVESVSGIANLIKIALAMHHKKFPATISKKKVNTFLDVDSAAHPLYIADREIDFADIRKDDSTPVRAGINSFADSGTNVHILVEEYLGGRRKAADAAQPKRLFVLSAKDARRLECYVQDYIGFLSAGEAVESFADLVYTAQTGREALSDRLAIVAASPKELLDKLALVKKNGIREKLGLDAKEIYYARVDFSDKNSLAHLITAEMAQMQLTQSQQSAQWKQIALLWVNGVTIPWATIWQGQGARRAALPTYPFARERHWVDIVEQTGVASYVAAAAEAAPVATAAAAPEAVAAAAWHFYLPSAAAAADASGLGRTEKMELFLKQEIARQLGLALGEVSLSKDFIELGMNSMGVAELIIRTDKLLDINLSPSVLFKYPEIGTLSEYLADTYADTVDALVVSATAPDAAAVRQGGSAAGAPARTTPADILIPLQSKGDRTPIFAVPGAGGSALSLQQLSHALGSQQPFYCLEPVGLDGCTPPMSSVEQIADFNIDALRSVQAAGPYRLLGYSNGGVVAFEMARKLQEQGEKIASLVLLDTLAPALLGADLIEEMTVAVYNHFVATLGGESDLDVEQLQRIPEHERSEFLYQRVVALGLELPKPQFVATFDVATASELGCRAYQPRRLAQKTDLVLIRATEAFENAPQDYGWSEYAAGALRTLDVQADHFSLLEKEPVAEVARQIEQPAGRPGKKAARDRAAAIA